MFYADKMSYSSSSDVAGVFNMSASLQNRIKTLTTDTEFLKKKRLGNNNKFVFKYRIMINDLSNK